VGTATVNQNALEDLVFELPVEYEVVFWRARADRHALRVQIEVPDRYRADACAALRSAIAARFGADSDVDGVPPGTLVPHRVLTDVHDVVKPRSLFGADEDWDKALLYY
jgi:phenylacetate-CoA ligase